MLAFTFTDRHFFLKKGSKGGLWTAKKSQLFIDPYLIVVESKNTDFRCLMGPSKTVQKWNVFYT